MPSFQSVHRLQRISGWKKNLFIIVSGVILGASTQYLSTHIWWIGNYMASMLINWVHGDCFLVIQGSIDLYRYVQMSLVGMVVEMIALIVVIIFMVFFFRDDDNVVEEVRGLRGDIDTMRKDLVSAINELRNSNDRLMSRIGGGNATTETTKEETNKAKGKTKGGETRDK